MMNHSIAEIQHGLGLHRPARSLLILEDDVLLVSIPEWGNTWNRFLLANLRYPEPPAIFANHDGATRDGRGFHDLPTVTGSCEYRFLPVFRGSGSGGAAGGRDGTTSLIPGTTSSNETERQPQPDANHYAEI